MGNNTTESELIKSILSNLGTEDESGDDRSTEERVLKEYRTEIDPRIVNAGWGFEAAKSIKHGKTDQSLLNHVRNGVFLLAQINEAVQRLDGYTLDETDLRGTIALFIIHDLHKLDSDRDADPASRFDIPREEVQQYVERFGLDSFAPDLTNRDFYSCATDHHDDWTANHDQSTRRFNDLRPFVRIADAFASCDTPEAAASQSVQSAINRAYLKSEFKICHHRLDDVKGILTNLINGAIAERLGDQDYQRLAIYQDGCVYIAPAEASQPDLDEVLIADLLDRLQKSIQTSHQAYSDANELQDNLTPRPKGFYGINEQEFFYAGAETVLEAVVRTAIGDADPDDDPTDSMAETMAELETHLPFDIERTRRPVGMARLVDTVRRSFIEPILEESDREVSGLEATCAIFGISDTVRVALSEARNDDSLSLTAGGKWDYAYGIGQALIEDGMPNLVDLHELVSKGLNNFDDEWDDIVEDVHTGNLRSELTAYLADIVSIDGRPLPETNDNLTDPFEEYHRTRRGKTCVLCNRGTTSTRKSDIKAPKSLTTLQAGYSNHIPVDAGKPDELLACIPCQVELSLRETGASRREGGRLFIHLVPDYFYTPLSWRSYNSAMSEFSGESRIELSRLAEAVLWLTGDLESGEIEGFESAFFDPDSGRSMAETLDQGFDPKRHYGARTLSYFKPQDNETEFQFFGVYVALAVAAYSGLRAYISESPIPDLRSRDFRTYVRIGGGFTQVHDFYGEEIPLSELQSQLRAASALIRLGYGADRNDALFAKFLRVTRDQLLPGSHLLKRLAQADDSSDARYLLEEAQVLDEETGIDTTTDTREVHDT